MLPLTENTTPTDTCTPFLCFLWNMSFKSQTSVEQNKDIQNNFLAEQNPRRGGMSCGTWWLDGTTEKSFGVNFEQDQGSLKPSTSPAAEQKAN